MHFPPPSLMKNVKLKSWRSFILIFYAKINCRTLKPKENLEFREDGTKLRFQSRPRYFFDKDRSEGRDPTVDVIINVNYIILVRSRRLFLWVKIWQKNANTFFVPTDHNITHFTQNREWESNSVTETKRKYSVRMRLLLEMQWFLVFGIKSEVLCIWFTLSGPLDEKWTQYVKQGGI